MRKKEIKQEIIDEIIKLYTTEPVGCKAIGIRFGLSREVVVRILKENNIPLTKPGQKYKGGKSEADKRYREKVNKDGKLNKIAKQWRLDNPIRNKENYQKWCDKNKEKIKEKKRINQQKLLISNPQYKLSQRFRTAIWQNIKDNGACKYNNTFNLLPYTFEELKQHLENLFEEGMSWDNYGLWHVDHAIPQSYFKYDDVNSDDFQICWSLENLKPMWGKVNMGKNNKLTYLSLEMISYLTSKNILLPKLDFKDIILSKEYLISCINNYGKDYVESYVDDVLDFIWKISPELPKYENNETIEGLKKYLENINPLDEDGNIVNHRINSYGNLYLKYRFNSFWKSSYKNNIPPIELWKNRNKMYGMLKYRMGVNNALNGKGEFFDISLYQCLKGLSALRCTISFFKPLLASFLYKKYLGDKENPIVFDPCCGFGGRLLGFKTIYPNGTYIGCEPNIETYNELIELSKEFTNVIIYNCKFEDLNIDFDYDLSLTSIPYFDLERYSNIVEYDDFDDWVNKFITPLLKLKNNIINMSYELAEKLDLLKYNDCYLINNKTHFHNKYKKEVILKICD